MYDFVIETSETGFDGLFNCLRGGDLGRSLEGCGVGYVQFTGDEADENLAKLCGCCPASAGCKLRAVISKGETYA